MHNCVSNIAIIEPSHIISEGLVNIIMRSLNHCHVYRYSDISELNRLLIDRRIDTIIVNPSLIQFNKENSILKRIDPEAYWIALVYSFFDRDILAQFDDIIQISDNPETIEHKLSNRVNSVNVDFNPKEQLSEREIDVLIQLVHGLSNKEIADKLHISIHTVISHRKNISQKTGIKSQSGLTIYAISNKIISLESLS